jgi:hypothetical protein
MKNKKIPEEIIKIAEDLKYLKDFHGINTTFVPARQGMTGSGANVIAIYVGNDLDYIRERIDEHLNATSSRSQLAILQGLMNRTIKAKNKKSSNPLKKIRKDMLGIIKDKIYQSEKQILSLYEHNTTLNNQEFTPKELHSIKITVFIDREMENHRKELIEALYHLSKVKDNIYKYFNQKP